MSTMITHQDSRCIRIDAVYTGKNYHLFNVENNRIKQSCAAHIATGSQQLILSNILEPEC